MLKNLLLAFIQAATEFLPISSSGHLALVSNLISEPDMFLFTALHLASLVAVIIFTRKEIAELLRFDKKHRPVWLYLAVATVPAALFGTFFENYIAATFRSFSFMGGAFIFTGIIIFLTKFKSASSGLNAPKSAIIGVFQALALFPGVSRSGMTISSALFMGVSGEKAVKFSFLLYIPLSIGAFFMEAHKGFYFNASLFLSFLVCVALSLLFLNILYVIIRKQKFWMFSIYCFIIGVITLCLR